MRFSSLPDSSSNSAAEKEPWMDTTPTFLAFIDCFKHGLLFLIGPFVLFLVADCSNGLLANEVVKIINCSQQMLDAGSRQF